MIAVATAAHCLNARNFRQPAISLRALKMGKILFAVDPDVKEKRRRYRVRDWVPSDGMKPGEFIVIIRLSDNAQYIAPRRWWRSDPRGLPVDTDEWAEAAWNAVRLHYLEQRKRRVQ